MTKRNSTKRALLMSVLSLLLCFSMLVGTTLAWFTDSVTSAGNIIKSGDLDVTMEWADGTKALPAEDSADWKDASEGAIFDYENWEPGYTVVRHIKIANEGSLALKYALSIVANGEVTDLSDVIDVYYLDPAEQIADRTALAGKTAMSNLTDALANLGKTGTGNLKSGEAVTVTLALKMREDAGNDYENKSIGTSFSIQLLATQLTYEKDSIDDQYDADAGYKLIYTFNNASELVAFDPYQFNGNDVGTGLTVANGKAVVNSIGAFFFRAVDLTKSSYTIEYDVDASALADGEMVQFDTGDTATWSANTPVTVTNGGVTISGATSVTETMGAILHVVHTYALNEDGVWVTTTTVTDGTNTAQNQKVQISSYPGTGNNVYWDIVGLTDTAADKVTIDNFEFYETALESDGADLTNAITVTPETLGTMVWEDNASYQFVGAFDAIDLVVPKGYTLVLDGSQATVTGRVSVSYGQVAGTHAEVQKGTPRSGSYTLQNFTAESIHAATHNTTVTLSGNKIEFLEIDSANVALNITGNKIDGNGESHTTFQNGTNKYGVYIYAMNYDLKFDGNTIEDTQSHSVGINGRQGVNNFAAGLTAADVTNTIISFSGNTIKISGAEENRAALKVWDDTIYAPNDAQTVLSEGAKDVIEMALAGGNTFTKPEGIECPTSTSTVYMPIR